MSEQTAALISGGSGEGGESGLAAEEPLLLWREEDAALRRLSLLASRLLIGDSLTWQGDAKRTKKCGKVE